MTNNHLSGKQNYSTFEKEKDLIEMVADKTELEWSDFNKRYDYLGDGDSLLYRQVKDSLDPKDLVIKRLLEDKAGYSRAAHYSSLY